MKNLLEIKFKIAEVLNLIKGFEVGHTSRVEDKIIIDHKGKRFIVSFKEIKTPHKDMLKDIDMYLY